MNRLESTAPATYTLAHALALVFGTPPFSAEYTTDHIRRVLSKLLGQELSEPAVLEQLRTAPYATPRPGRGRHLLKWRFSRAEVGDGAAPPPPRRHKPPRQERSVAQSMGLKR
ncbi:hypothetical protein ACFPAF_17055 [Hymenobacter endophyticus]|uniref:Uncharacterized protein n=1 Tax=Hymenobacter endophyticus TaxID=3076335 RepID=A0ABU3TL58_9BACT|nr:hypothetical protein [Hymenobacter endophyticus]MDU0372114.1 hypothetical protein [Hymenobacter endophyticus]